MSRPSTHERQQSQSELLRKSEGEASSSSSGTATHIPVSDRSRQPSRFEPSHESADSYFEPLSDVSSTTPAGTPGGILKPKPAPLGIGIGTLKTPLRSASGSRPPTQRQPSRVVQQRRKSRSRMAGSASESEDDIFSDGGFSSRLRSDHASERGQRSDDEVEPLDRGEQLVRRRMQERRKEKRRLAALAQQQQHPPFSLSSNLASSTHRQHYPHAASSSHGADFTDLDFSEADETPAKSRPSTIRRLTIDSNPSTAPPSPVAVMDPSSSRPTVSANQPEKVDARRVSYARSPTGEVPPPIESAASSVHSQDDEQDMQGAQDGEVTDSGSDVDADEYDDDVEYTLKDRQDAINIEHPFGLPIWKPALYKKSRSVTRNAETDLHLAPSSAVEHHLLPGNILWTISFGFLFALVCSVVSAVLWILPFGGSKYGRVVFDLGGYLFWPFGRYVEGWDPEGALFGQPFSASGGNAFEKGQAPIASDARYDDSDDESDVDVESGLASGPGRSRSSTVTAPPVASTPASTSGSSSGTLKPLHHSPSPSVSAGAQESTMLNDGTARNYGTTFPETEADGPSSDDDEAFRIRALGRLSYWAVFYVILAPAMLTVCVLCWAMVFTVPMAKLLWALTGFLAKEPLALHFRSAPKYHAGPSEEARKPPPLKPGQLAPKHSPKVYAADIDAGRLIGPNSKILLCIYKAVGLQYYKYTIDGVNIMFINLLPVVFFVIIDGFIIRKSLPSNPSALLRFISADSTIFVLALASVIPLSYFIGMAVASISAQSSIGMGAVINATFGSIIEVILYAIALIQGKAVLVEGSIVGSLLAGVLLMPGVSMISGAVRRKEQKFNARSAGVTSTMLIMAIIGTLTPTLFYETYGTFQLSCEGCPSGHAGQAWTCSSCHYQHVDPVDDPFYKTTVQYLSYCCATILVMSYLVGLWFSLRTHASQIWQNAQSAPSLPPSMPPSVPQSAVPPAIKTGKRAAVYDAIQKLAHHSPERQRAAPGVQGPPPSQKSTTAPPEEQNTSVQLPPGLTAEDFSRVIEVVAATASAFRVQQHDQPAAASSSDPAAPGHATDGSPFKRQVSQLSYQHPKDTSHGSVQFGTGAHVMEHVSHGGHDAPNWSRAKSASVLMGCTVLYAIIAELLVDVVDVVLDGSGIPEKFLGITLFALVPNTTEFMNAISFALSGNIALSMEIGSAYALQVCLLQIPAMVAFTYFYSKNQAVMLHHAFTLVFPKWDVIAILFAVFLLTYVYLEARANYYRGSILFFSYVVLLAGFYFAPANTDTEDAPGLTLNLLMTPSQPAPHFTLIQQLKTWAHTIFVR